MSGCCVCLKNEPPLTCIAETDKINGNWHSKLSTCVPEIVSSYLRYVTREIANIQIIQSRVWA